MKLCIGNNLCKTIDGSRMVIFVFLFLLFYNTFPKLSKCKASFFQEKSVILIKNFFYKVINKKSFIKKVNHDLKILLLKNYLPCSYILSFSISSYNGQLNKGNFKIRSTRHCCLVELDNNTTITHPIPKKGACL